MNIAPDAAQADLSAYSDWKIAASLSADGGEIALNGSMLELPPFATAVLIPNS